MFLLIFNVTQYSLLFLIHLTLEELCQCLVYVTEKKFCTFSTSTQKYSCKGCPRLVPNGDVSVVITCRLFAKDSPPTPPPPPPVGTGRTGRGTEDSPRTHVQASECRRQRPICVEQSYYFCPPVPCSLRSLLLSSPINVDEASERH